MSSRRPTQRLNIHCSNCGAVTVRFESFVVDGTVFEMVGQKLSEMLSFISTSPEAVLCTACTEEAAAEAENRRLEQRERIRQQMELQSAVPAVPPGASGQPATYSTASPQRKQSKLQPRVQAHIESARPAPRRAVSNKELYTSVR